MSKSGKENNEAVRRRMRAKESDRRQDSREGALAGRGPIGLFVAKMIDLILKYIVKAVKWIWYKLTIPIFNMVYNLLFSEFRGIFAGKEKDGDCYGSSYFRYIITILVPPVGIFLSKGLMGWPSICISVVLCFYHMFPGIIYALLVTYSNRYADRYEAKEFENLERQKLARGKDENRYTFTSLVVSIAILVGILYLMMLLAKKVGDYGMRKIS